LCRARGLGMFDDSQVKAQGMQRSWTFGQKG
jgi:hypothetical protein